jgi:hypothetical protein
MGAGFTGGTRGHVPGQPRRRQGRAVPSHGHHRAGRAGSRCRDMITRSGRRQAHGHGPLNGAERQDCAQYPGRRTLRSVSAASGSERPDHRIGVGRICARPRTRRAEQLVMSALFVKTLGYDRSILLRDDRVVSGRHVAPADFPVVEGRRDHCRAVLALTGPAASSGTAKFRGRSWPLLIGQAQVPALPS